jgi:hypothetical protein
VNCLSRVIVDIQDRCVTGRIYTRAGCVPQEDFMGVQDHLSLRTASMPGVVEGAENRLRSNSYLALKNVSCEFREGVLTLRGYLPSYYLKQMRKRPSPGSKEWIVWLTRLK